MLVTVGWQGHKRVNTIVLHIDVVDDQVLYSVRIEKRSFRHASSRKGSPIGSLTGLFLTPSGKIWNSGFQVDLSIIQCNNTDQEIAQELAEAGIPASAITYPQIDAPALTAVA